VNSALPTQSDFGKIVDRSLGLLVAHFLLLENLAAERVEGSRG
jgi:hypothetical protein